MAGSLSTMTAVALGLPVPAGWVAFLGYGATLDLYRTATDR